MITATTRVAAVIGSPIRHSLSPTIHNAAFDATGLDWVYVASEVEPGRAGEAVTAMRVLDLGGLSVTMPHKEDVTRAVDVLDRHAERVGCVNCVAWEGGRLVGHNTDGPGFIAACRDDLDLDFAGARVGVIGAGGAARSVVSALVDVGADAVVVVNRDRARAERAVALAPDIARLGDHDELRDVDVIVNATSVGMGDDAATPLAPDLLADQIVVDLVYEPRSTPLLDEAARRGLRFANGVGMLTHQAAHAFTLWTGVAAPLDAMRRAVEGKNH